jgi:hypothetical protein
MQVIPQKLGVQAFTGLFKQDRWGMFKPLPVALKIEPHKYMDIGAVAAMTNSVLIRDALPSELTKKPTRPLSPRYATTLVNAQLQANALVGSPKTEHTVSSTLVKNQLSVARDGLIERDPDAKHDLTLMAFAETNYSACWKQNARYWYQVRGRADGVVNVQYPLPATKDPLPTCQFDKDALSNFQIRCEDSISVPLGLATYDDGYHFDVLKNTPPYFRSGFVVKQCPFPALGVCVEFKKSDLTPAALGQCVLYLATSLVSSTFYTGNNSPATAIGFVGNGFQLATVVFQLNTLDFNPNSQVKNVIWVKNSTIMTPDNICNLETLDAAISTLEYIVNAQRDAAKKVTEATNSNTTVGTETSKIKSIE